MSGKRTLFERLSEDPRVLNAAWSEVHRNARSTSYGVDHQYLSDYAAHLQTYLTKLRLTLKRGDFKFSNLRGTAIMKADGTPRPLKVATIEDRVIQKSIELLIRKQLNATYNVFNNPVSYAFIKTEDIDDYDPADPQTFKGVRGALEKLKSYRSQDYSWCLKADIIDFFGNVDVNMLLENYIFPALEPDKSMNDIIRQAFQQEVEVENSIRDYLGEENYQKMLLNNGLPQGSILSPLFSNVYLSIFDQKMSDLGYILIRYVDDFIVLTKTEKDAQEVYGIVTKMLKKLKLNIHKLGTEKTTIRSTDDVTFLGIRFLNGQFYPSEKAYKKLGEKLQQYPKYKSLIKNLQSLQTLVQSWAATYYFCSPDSSAYSQINDGLLRAVKETLRISRLRTSVKFGQRELRRLGIYQFDNAIASFRQKRTTPKVSVGK